MVHAPVVSVGWRSVPTDGESPGSGGATMRPYIEAGFKPLPGYQLRYLYFLSRDARSRLTVPEIPFARIDEIGAGMYKGVVKTGVASVGSDTPGVQPGEGGATPTATLLT